MALTNAQYREIMDTYEALQADDRRTLAARHEEVLSRIPAYAALESSVGSHSAQTARLLLEGDDSALESYHAKLAEIAARKEALLAEAGFPADYLQPTYHCRYCQDTGYLPMQNGPKRKCECFLRRERALLYAQSHIEDLIATENFSTLSYEYYQGEDLVRFRNCVHICEEFVQNFKQDFSNLLFYGTVGTGKSFLSGCIAKELLDHGTSVLYFSAVSLFETLARYTFCDGEQDALAAFTEDLYETELLIIDDLGTELTNAFVSSQLFSCLNERKLRTRSTIISTNLGLEELRDRYSDRVFSRITSNFTICKLTGPDIRMYKKL